MNLHMIRAEIMKITGRRGSFYSAVGITLLLAVFMSVSMLIYRSSERNPEPVSGSDGLEIFEGAAYVSLLLIVLVTSQVGSWDAAMGTFRYLLMTGKSRLALFFARVPAVLAVTAIVLAPLWIIGLAHSLLVPVDDGTTASAREIGAFLWNTGFPVAYFALVAMFVGALTQSNGVGIIVSLFFALGGFILSFIVAVFSEDVAHYLPNVAVYELSGIDTTASKGLATVVAVFWFVAFALGGIWRTETAEY
jgi:hypothetical protein